MGNLYHSWHVGQGPDTIGFRPREGGVKDNNGKLHIYLPLTVSSQRSSLASSDFGGYDAQVAVVMEKKREANKRERKGLLGREREKEGGQTSWVRKKLYLAWHLPNLWILFLPRVLHRF